jgi:hypothetical protein
MLPAGRLRKADKPAADVQAEYYRLHFSIVRLTLLIKTTGQLLSLAGMPKHTRTDHNVLEMALIGFEAQKSIRKRFMGTVSRRFSFWLRRDLADARIPIAESSARSTTYCVLVEC